MVDTQQANNTLGQDRPKPLYVGLSGPARSGKDSVGLVLVQEGFTRVAFGDKVRDCAMAIDPYVMCEGPPGMVRLTALVSRVGWEEAKAQGDVRRLLKHIGHDMGRMVLDYDMWVTQAFKSAPLGDVVFTDVRYVNEAEAIKAKGGVVWSIRRPGYDFLHKEHAMEDWAFDAVLNNVGTLSDLLDLTLLTLDRFRYLRG